MPCELITGSRTSELVTQFGHPSCPSTAKDRSLFREVRYKTGFHRSCGARSSMKRRAFILGLSAALASLSKALAQRNLRVIGIWWSPLQVQEILTPYKARLAELGWMEGRKVPVEAREGGGGTTKKSKKE